LEIMSLTAQATLTQISGDGYLQVDSLIWQSYCYKSRVFLQVNHTSQPFIYVTDKEKWDRLTDLVLSLLPAFNTAARVRISSVFVRRNGNNWVFAWSLATCLHAQLWGFVFLISV
jgi:hypothetical protein